MLLIGPLGTNFSENLIEILTFFIQKNAIESVACKMAAILSRPQCVNGIGFKGFKGFLEIGGHIEII